MTKLKAFIKLIRVQQWVKNSFIFLPMFFGLRITEFGLLVNAIWAFFGFSLVASAVYVFNDWLDIESDKLHPKKKDRPLASGVVTKTEALVLISVLILAGVGIYVVFINNFFATLLLSFYIIQNIFYTIKLKNIAIVDITIIAIGFVIRILMGGVVTGTELSNWIILITFLLALFLGLTKRRDDVLIFLKTGDLTRKNIGGYNLEFLNASMTIMSSIVIVSYIMYTISPPVMARVGNYLYLTTFFVILGIMRHLQIVFVEQKSGDPSKILLGDRLLQLIIIGWIVSFIVILYFKKLPII